MAYNTPHTATPLSVITAAGHNTSIRDNLEYLKGRAGTIAFQAGATFAGTLVATGGISGASYSGGPISGSSGAFTAPVTIDRTFAFSSKYGNGSVVALAYIDSADKHRYGATNSAQVLIAMPNSASGLAVDHAASGVGKIWHEFNDGAGSNLDADLLDGLQGSAYSLSANNTYTGDGGTGGRQITCGFVPRSVFIIGGDNTADLDAAILVSTSGALRFIQASPVTYITSVKLRGDDGFTVGSGNDFCNQGGRTYRWAAYR